MRDKRRARELALQFLYQVDIRGEDILSTLDDFLLSEREGAVPYARMLIEKCVNRLSDIDSSIEKWSENWDIERMAIVDRNILRIGVYEMLFSEDIPPKVAIDEAIEVAKTFGDADSPGFVNGILDGIYRNCPKNSEAV